MSSNSRTPSAQPINCYVELGALDSIVKECHTASNKDEQIVTPFASKINKSTWHARCLAPLAGQLYGNNEYVFRVAKEMGYLQYLVFRHSLPKITVTDPSKYRIRYCENLANNACAGYNLFFSEVNIQRLNSYVMDVYSEFHSAKDYQKHQEMIGNRKELREWTDTLQATQVKSVPPFNFRDNKKSSLRLCAMELNQVEVRATFRSSIYDLVQGQKLVEDSNGKKAWAWMKKSELPSVLVSAKQNLDAPQVFGKYVLIIDEEKESMKAEPQKSLMTRFDYYTSSRVRETDGHVDVKLQCSYPATALYFVAENQRALEYNVYSNYTTNQFKPEDGYSVIRSVSMYLDTHAKFENYPFDLFADSEGLTEFPSVPKKRGYGALAVSSDVTSSDLNGGVSYAKVGAYLRFAVEDVSGDEENNNDYYVIQVIAALKMMTETSDNTVTILGNA